MGKPRLLDRVREAIRVRHYSLRTEEVYLQWVRRYILFHGKRHPDDMGEAEVAAFLSYLAMERNVAAATQNQALSAILFLYTNVLGRDLDWLKDVARAKRPRRLPVVLSRDEIQRVLARMVGINSLLARLMYGTGMRAMESLQLRVKDVDFSYRQVIIREGKGTDQVVRDRQCAGRNADGSTGELDTARAGIHRIVRNGEVVDRGAGNSRVGGHIGDRREGRGGRRHSITTAIDTEGGAFRTRR